MSYVQNRHALVTGVSRGLGLAIARRLLCAGWAVSGTSRTESHEWRVLVDQFGNRADWRFCDLSNPRGVKEALFSKWIPLRRPVHALVNNAAYAYDDLVSNVALPQLEEMFAVNIMSPILITREVLRNMVFNGVAGGIVHVSSISVHAGAKGLAMYAASKGALEAFSKNTAREWGGRGIRSNCIVPGYMDTEMTSALSSEQRMKIQGRTALKRPVDIDSVAATVEYLLSDGAGSISGQNIFADGGFI